MNLGCAFQLPKTSNAVAFHGLTTGCLRRAVPFVMAGNRYGCKEKKRPPYRKVISRNEDVKKWRKFTVQAEIAGCKTESDAEITASRFFCVTSGSLLAKHSEQSVSDPRQTNSGGSGTQKEI